MSTSTYIVITPEFNEAMTGCESPNGLFYAVTALDGRIVTAEQSRIDFAEQFAAYEAEHGAFETAVLDSDTDFYHEPKP